MKQWTQLVAGGRTVNVRDPGCFTAPLTTYFVRQRGEVPAHTKHAPSDLPPVLAMLAECVCDDCVGGSVRPPLHRIAVLERWLGSPATSWVWSWIRTRPHPRDFGTWAMLETLEALCALADPMILSGERRSTSASARAAVYTYIAGLEGIELRRAGA